MGIHVFAHGDGRAANNPRACDTIQAAKNDDDLAFPGQRWTPLLSAERDLESHPGIYKALNQHICFSPEVAG